MFVATHVEYSSCDDVVCPASSGHFVWKSIKLILLALRKLDGFQAIPLPAYKTTDRKTCSFHLIVGRAVDHKASTA